MTRQFFLFLVASGIAACVNFGSRMLLSLWIPFVPAVTIAFFAGLTTAFLLNRALVFERSGRHWGGEAGWFVAVNMVGLALTVGVSWLLATHLLPALGQTRFVEETAHAAGILAPVVTSYFGHKHLSFGKRR